VAKFLLFCPVCACSCQARLWQRALLRHTDYIVAILR